MKLKTLVAITSTVFALGAGLSTSAYAQGAERPMLRISSGASDNATLDPHRATSTADKGVASQMFDGLVRFPPGSADPKKLEADLAESWEMSPDAKVWTFKLR
ncbi:MAG TPA: polyamine ABC transporter substrate-binding protein, partial [Burkholderiaceae bacterium]|nr:polyamine ABC transporter substrate-binding protein [Burkholderiaceae bacterium]